MCVFLHLKYGGTMGYWNKAYALWGYGLVFCPQTHEFSYTFSNKSHNLFEPLPQNRDNLYLQAAMEIWDKTYIKFFACNRYTINGNYFYYHLLCALILVHKFGITILSLHAFLPHKTVSSFTAETLFCLSGSSAPSTQ